MESLEFLKDALGDELYTQFTAKLEGNDTIKLANLADGRYIPKDKFDAERTSSKQLRSQIDELNSRIASMQTETAGVDAIKAQLSQLQSDLAAKDAEMKSQKMDYSILESARKHNAKDPELMARMIDKSKIAEKDDSFIGLDEQFEELAKTYAYMFANAPAPVGGFDPSRGQQSNGMTENSIMNNLIRSSAGHN